MAPLSSVRRMRPDSGIATPTSLRKTTASAGSATGLRMPLSTATRRGFFFWLCTRIAWLCARRSCTCMPPSPRTAWRTALYCSVHCSINSSNVTFFSSSTLTASSTTSGLVSTTTGSGLGSSLTTSFLAALALVEDIFNYIIYMISCL